MGAVDAIEWTCVLCGRWIQNDWVEQWICIKFRIRQNSFLHGNYLGDSEDLSYGQLVIGSFITTMHPCIMSHAEFFGKTSNHPGDSAPCSPDLVPCDSWLFPKLKSPLKGKRFHLWKGMRFRKLWWVSRWRLGQLCEVPKGLLWRGLRHHCSVYNVSCILHLLP